MLQDEARFGRITDPRRCWAPPGARPVVGKQMVREHTYLYGAVSPLDGRSDHLILPAMDAARMNAFLAEVGRRHAEAHVLMIYDGAPCHSPGVVELPGDMSASVLPPYCPELDPQENVWDEIREKYFSNRVFDTMESVEEQLVVSARAIEKDQERMRSITGWKWIVDHL